MVIATTVGGLAATGISYVSSMNTITAQRAELDKMWAKVHLLSSALSSSGRQFAPRLEDPISKGNSKVISTRVMLRSSLGSIIFK